MYYKIIVACTTGLPSLALEPAGCERSRIKHHFLLQLVEARRSEVYETGDVMIYSWNIQNTINRTTGLRHRYYYSKTVRSAH